MFITILVMMDALLWLSTLFELPVPVSAAFFGLIFTGALYGWGQLVRSNFLKGWPSLPRSLVILLGVWAGVFFGGPLHFFGAANVWFAFIFLVLGHVLLIFFGGRYLNRTLFDKKLIKLPHRSTSGMRALRFVGDVLGLSLLCICTIFLFLTTIPNRMFNPGDDFWHYLSRPLRLFSTGRVDLQNNIFDSMNIADLGAHALFQSMGVAFGQHFYLSFFDEIFCFFLSGLVIYQACKYVTLSRSARILALILFVIIHPQTVNLSAVYAATFVGVGAFVLCFAALRVEARHSLGVFFVMGGVCGTLLCFKTTNLIFSVCAMVLFSLALANEARISRLKSFFGSTVGFAATTVFWIFSSDLFTREMGEKLWNVFSFGKRSGDGTTSRFGNLEVFFSPEFFLDATPSIWGANHLAYTGLYLGLFFSLCVVLWKMYKKPREHPLRELRLIGATFTLVLLTQLVLAFQVRAPSALRYNIPFLLAFAPLAWAYLLSRFRIIEEGILGKKGLVHALIIVLYLVSLSPFFPSSIARYRQAFEYGHTLPYPSSLSKAQRKYVAWALQSSTGEALQRIMKNVPKGKGVLVWISLPFHLDAKRNPIFTLHQPGLLDPEFWTRSDPDLLLQSVQERMKNFGIEYILWQKKGFGLPEYRDHTYSLTEFRLAQGAHAARYTMSKLAGHSQILFENDTMVLFQL